MSFKKKEISDDASALADDSDGPVADSAASDSGRSGPAISKRAFLKGAATAPFAAAGAKYSIGRSRAVAPIGVGVAVGAGAAAGYLMREVQDYVTGPSVDTGAYDALSADEMHADLRQKAVSSRESDKTVLTTMDNLLAVSKNAAFSDAKYAAIEQMNLGNSEADAKTAAENAIDKYYGTQQKNLLSHLSVQNVKLDTMFAEVVANKDKVDASQVPSQDSQREAAVQKVFAIDWSEYNQTLNTESKGLLNGESFTYSWFEINGDGSSGRNKSFKIGSTTAISIRPVQTGMSQTFLDMERYTNVWNEIESQHTTVTSEINTWVTSVYPNYTSGDVKLSELVNASDIADKAPNEQGYSYAGADLALMGLEGADHAYSIELMESGEIVKGTIYAQGRTDPLELGTVYSPSSISGTVWLAYETEDDSGNTVSDLVALEQDFQVLDGTDSEGNSVSEVTFSSKNQQTTDTDVQKVQEELQQLQELQNELEKQQQQEVSSGGGGFVDSFAIGDLPGAATLALIGGGVLVLLGQDDN